MDHFLSARFPGAVCRVAGLMLVLVMMASPFSVSQAALRCPTNNPGKPCSLAAALETCETYMDEVRIPPFRRCKTPGDTACHWCGVRGTPPVAVVIYYWTTSGVPGWTWNTGTWWVTSTKQEAGKNLGQPDFCPEGNPINQATGNKFQLESDYVSPVAGGLAFKRYYNSLEPTHGSLGTHWRSHYDRHLDTRYHESTLTLVRADGKRHVFWQTPYGGWQGEPDVAHRLEALEDAAGTLSGWAYRSVEDTLEVYDLAGKLRSITERSGRTQTLHYDAEQRLATVTGPFGRALSFAYDDAHRVVSMTDPGGGRYRYDYDDQGNLISVHYPDETFRHYLYEDPQHVHALTGVIDENGARFATWAYDAQGRAVSSEHADGAQRISLSYPGDGTTTVSDALGASRRYAFAIRHGVLRPKRISGDQCGSCGGSAQTFDYDANGYLEAKTDRNGNLTRYAYNERGLQISRTEAADTPQARTITTAWHADYRLPIRIEDAGKRTEFTYYANGLLRTRSERDIANDATRTWTYTYTAEGLLDTVDGPRSEVQDVTDYDYDAQGNRIRITNALGHVTEITAYDAHGRPLRLIDANGVTTTLVYDARGRLRTRTVGTGAEAARTEFAYDNAGKLKHLTLPNGATLDYGYDSAQRLTAITDGLGNRIEYTLDAMGNRTREAIYDASGTLRRTRTGVYDHLGRLSEALGAASQGTRYGYDANGNRTSLTDALGRVTSQAFDALDRLIGVTDPLGGVTVYEYDAADRPISVTDPRGLSTRYRYDGLGNRLEQDSPDTGLSSYTYDAAGNLLTQTDARGIITRYRYDALNRLIAVHYPDARLDVTFGYDQGAYGIGRLSRMRDASGLSDYRYDARGNLIEAAHTLQGAAYITQYRYDLADKLIQIRYPSGRTLDYVRNPAGAIRTVSTTANQLSETLAAAIDYAPFGGLGALNYGNGLSAVYHYDLEGRLSALTTAPIHAQEYTYDPVGNITAITDTLHAADSQSFGYDSLDRLNEETGSYGSRDYAYDALGNRTRRIRQELRTDEQGNPVTRMRTQDYVYEEQTHRLVRINRRPHRYDAAGNLLSDRAARRQFSYDDRGRLSAFTRRGALKASYYYDGQGRRVIKRKHTAKGAKPTHFHYAPDGRLLAETVYTHQGIKKVVREYLWLDTMPLAQIRTRYRNNGTIKDIQKVFLHSDHLNTPRLATDVQQRIVWRWQGDAFGHGRADTDPDGDGRKVNVRLRFPGQYKDAESGLHYNYFRDYDPDTGRYIQSDPIGLAASLNTYVFTDSNPIIKTDPYGLESYADDGDWTGPNGNGVVNVGGGFGGSFHSLLVGIFVSEVIGFDTNGNKCIYTTLCGRLRPGIYAGVGWPVSIGPGSLPSENSGNDWIPDSFGFGFDYGTGASIGLSMGIGQDSANFGSGMPGLKPGFGGGFVAGVDICWVKQVVCKSQCE